MQFLKKTKIVATLGPASDSPEAIEKLMLQGANVFRLNFSHGSHPEHARTIELIQAAIRKTGLPAAILADLQGPKIRTGRTRNDQEISLQAGTPVQITARPAECTDQLISIDYPPLLDDLRAENIILLNDGAVALKVTSIDKNAQQATCEVLNSGRYSSHKGVNFPHAQLSLPALTEKDRADLEFILVQPVQFIALSFVRSPKDLLELREIISGTKKDIRLIAKIEKPEAADQVEKILEVCDGIMVARGDLGVETSVATVPVLQKDLIQRANQAGRSVIVATQMLESMIENATPTRAEASDVANALLDGTDAVMLSGETAVGQYPVRTVEIMTQIIRATEKSSYYARFYSRIHKACQNAAHAVCEAAALASQDLGNIPILVFTLSGNTAWYVSKIRTQAPLLAFSPSEQVVLQLSLAWNTAAFHLPFENDLVRLIQMAEEKLLATGWVANGDWVVIISGTVPVQGATNFLRIKRVGEA
jgi:pyruvate kinase